MPFQDYGYKPSGITRPKARPAPKPKPSSSYYSGNEFGSGNIFTETSPGASTVNFGNNNNNNDNDNNSYQAPSLMQPRTPTVTAPAAPTPAQIEAERQDRIARVFEATGATLPQDTGRGGSAGRGMDLYSRDIFKTPFVATPDNTQEIEDYLGRTAVEDALREALGVPEVYQGMPTQEEPETNIDMSVLQEALQPEPITVEELPDGTTPEMFEGIDGSYMFEDTDEEQPKGLMSRRFDTKGETPARELPEVLSIPEAASYMGRKRAGLIMEGINKLFGMFPPKTDVEKQAKTELEYFLDAQPESSLPDFFKYVPDKVQLAEYMKGRAERKKAAGTMNFTEGDVDTSNLQIVDVAETTTASDKVDFDFIKEREGYKKSMYVPKDKKGTVLGKSGATIASGFDLGQRNEADLKGLPTALVKKLKPYLGKKGSVADTYVKNNPLTLTTKEADQINKFAKKQEINRLKDDWESASDVAFEDLTKEQATVVASVAFQYGDLPTETPTFWRHVTNGDWDKAEAELRNFGDEYTTRRTAEADYLAGS